MNKLLSIFFVALLSLFTFSCTDDDINSGVDNDTLAEVYELKNVNFENDGNGFQVYRTFTNALYQSDMVLVYRQVEVNNGSTYWEPIPKTFYLNNGQEVDYTFDFSAKDVTIYAGGTFDLTGSEYVRNQTFRVVVIPAIMGKSTQTVNFDDYNAVMNYYHLNQTPVKGL